MRIPTDILLKAMDVCHMSIMILKLEDPGEYQSIRIIYMNQTAKDENSLPLDQVLGKTLKEAFPAVYGDYKAFLDAYIDAFNGKKGHFGAIEYEDENSGESVSEIFIEPIDSTHIAINYESVIELQEMNRQLKRQVKELEIMNESMINRELRMKELKEEIQQLKK